MKPYPHVIETERLLLRPFELSDASRVRELVNRREIYEVTSLIPYPYDEGMAEAWISTHKKAYFEDRGVIFAIVEKESLELIGAIGIGGDKENKRGTLGYWLGVPYWGKGYATEAARVVLGFVFNVLEYHRIEADHFECNPASGRVLQKIGMQREGRLIDHVCKEGKYHTCIVYGIVNE
jgi:RimJ/RimL family protein N-acetyltransferase